MKLSKCGDRLDNSVRADMTTGMHFSDHLRDVAVTLDSEMTVYVIQRDSSFAEIRMQYDPTSSFMSRHSKPEYASELRCP